MHPNPLVNIRDDDRDDSFRCEIEDIKVMFICCVMAALLIVYNVINLKKS